MRPRCNGCGRTDLPTRAFRCEWPDKLVTLDRHCAECQHVWHAQLRSLGARLEPLELSMPVITPGAARVRELASAIAG